MNGGALWDTVVLSAAVAAIARTTSRSEVFKSLRHEIAIRNAWLGYLVRCPYCTSHWLAFLATALYRPQIVTGSHWSINLVVTAFSMIAFSTIFFGLMRYAYEGMVPSDLDSLVEEKEEETEVEDERQDD